MVRENVLKVSGLLQDKTMTITVEPLPAPTDLTISTNSKKLTWEYPDNIKECDGFEISQNFQVITTVGPEVREVDLTTTSIYKNLNIYNNYNLYCIRAYNNIEGISFLNNVYGSGYLLPMNMNRAYSEYSNTVNEDTPQFDFLQDNSQRFKWLENNPVNNLTLPNLTR